MQADLRWSRDSMERGKRDSMSIKAELCSAGNSQTITIVSMRLSLHLISTGLLCLCIRAASVASNVSKSSTSTSYPRIFVVTDISNEPDDQMSLVCATFNSEHEVWH